MGLNIELLESQHSLIYSQFLLLVSFSLSLPSPWNAFLVKVTAPSSRPPCLSLSLSSTSSAHSLVWFVFRLRPSDVLPHSFSCLFRGYIWKRFPIWRAHFFSFFPFSLPSPDETPRRCSHCRSHSHLCLSSTIRWSIQPTRIMEQTCEFINWSLIRSSLT